MTGAPRTFFMHLPEAVLAFQSGADEYVVYSLPPREQRLPKDEWEAIRPGLESTGRIPLSDVEFDEASRLIRMDTIGIERFVDS